MNNLIELELPDFWASPLINGDESGLDDMECDILDKFTDYMLDKFGSCHCVDVSPELDFKRWHDASEFGVLACDVATFTFAI
jgi:hypothetical protein